MNDIQVDPVVLRQVRYEELQKHREQVKDSDDKWQDDLTKWKNRRRSVNSDIVKKKEEREQIEHITIGGDSRRSKTFKEMQEERGNREKKSVGSRLGSLSFLSDDQDIFDQDIFDHPVASPRTRGLPTRSNTIDTPYSCSVDHFSAPSVPSLSEEDPPAEPPATGRASSPPTSQEVDIVDSLAGSFTTTTIATTASTDHRPRSPTAAPMERHTNAAKAEETSTTTASSGSSFQREPELRRPLAGTQTVVEAPSSSSLYRQQYNPVEPKPPGVSRVSASLPRSYQRSDSERLTSVVTARPFGTQSTRVTSFPRAFTMEESQKRVNGDVDVSKKSSVPSRYHQFMTSEDEARSHSSSAPSSEAEDEREETTGESVAAAQSVSPVPPQVKSEAPASPAPVEDTNQEHYCDMRINLNQKPNSSRDFGFQAEWDSTGAHITSIQPGSSAEMCQLLVGDEVLTLGGHRVADMSYTDWKGRMEEALQQGSLVMDIRRHGQNSSPEANTRNTSLDFTSRISTGAWRTKEAPAHPAIDVASNGVNGGFRGESVTMRNKESEPISLKNLKRRSEFFEQGGSESAISDIPVPSIAPSSNHWSWDPEEERRRQEKWQKEQERLLQEKYKRDQEKLEEEWRMAQQDIADSTHQQKGLQQPRRLEVNEHSVSPHSPLSPLSPLSQPTPPWEDKEEEERKSREEQERQRQAEEKRKRDEEERELQRLQEERKMREKQEEEERNRREEEELRWQRRREEEREAERRRQEAAEQQQQWAKSKSTTQLDDVERPEGKVTSSGAGEASWRDSQRKGQQISPSELERQRILQEMKKKTHLLTDNSWIRQRSTGSATSKEPVGLSMRRGESLDNLDAPRTSWRSSWTPGSTSSIPNYSRPHSALPGSTSHYGGGTGARPGSATLPSSYSTGSLRGLAETSPSQRSTSPSPSSPSPTASPEPSAETRLPQQRSRSVSGKKICTFCDAPLGKGAAMIIESLGLCYHLGCFKCIDCESDLGGSEAGAEVRIRSKQLYCNSCYMRFKTGQPTSM